MNPERKPVSTVSRMRAMLRHLRFMEISARAFSLAMKAKLANNEPLRAHWWRIGERFRLRANP